MSIDQHCSRTLTEWTPNGNVMKYARSNPEANRLQLVSLIVSLLGFFLLLIKDFELLEVMSGVTYLHDLVIVHGDLKVRLTFFTFLHLTDK